MELVQSVATTFIAFAKRAPSASPVAMRRWTSDVYAMRARSFADDERMVVN